MSIPTRLRGVGSNQHADQPPATTVPPPAPSALQQHTTAVAGTAPFARPPALPDTSGLPAVVADQLQLRAAAAATADPAYNLDTVLRQEIAQGRVRDRDNGYGLGPAAHRGQTDRYGFDRNGHGMWRDITLDDGTDVTVHDVHDVDRGTYRTYAEWSGHLDRTGPADLACRIDHPLDDGTTRTYPATVWADLPDGRMVGPTQVVIELPAGTTLDQALPGLLGRTSDVLDPHEPATATGDRTGRWRTSSRHRPPWPQTGLAG